MERKLQIKTVLDFIKRNNLGVLSTVIPSHSPQSAVMIISQKDNLELIFQTPNDSRKYPNLKKNPKVAIAFGFNLEEFTTVQYEGEAKEALGNEIDECRKIHVAKNPKSAEYAYLPKNKYFIVSPKWIRYWDLNKNEKFTLVL